MKYAATLALFCLLAAFGLAQAVPEIPFDSNPDFFKLPDDLHFGETAGVAVNSQGQVYVYSRGNTTGPAYGATASQILLFDRNGKFMREIGKNLYAWSFAHTVRVDRQDNLWAVDKGSDMIVKFNPQGRVMMVFGRKSEASDENAHPLEHPNPPRPAQDGRFRQPTDVTWDPEGNIFISDGYINSRVAKLDKNGDWIKQWGGPVPAANRANPAPGEFNTPHSIAADAQGNIYVADRGNRRIQVYDKDGNFKKIITIDVPVAPNAKSWFSNAGTPQEVATAGAPWAVCITPGPGTQYLYSADAYPGRVYKLSLDGKVLGWLGRSGRQPKEFGWIHEMACPSENELYVAEILNWRVQKLTLKPGK
ncbi:MAG: peptidyl-alpha-hydroxyglycine alpha-amidating lyase family protein [Acidobacteriia bacterium]|nr:peptidyl-alpha-hydroxyglycine alpha-amidating lyase family protein [Terriglobia bacterium]